MTVLDASAVLALLLDEPSADVVQEALNGAVLSNVSLAEVLAKLTDRGQDIDGRVDDLRSAGLHLEPVSRVDAEHSAQLRSQDHAHTLSLGDRCCLALGRRRSPSSADRCLRATANPAGCWPHRQRRSTGS